MPDDACGQYGSGAETPPLGCRSQAPSEEVAVVGSGCDQGVGNLAGNCRRASVALRRTWIVRTRASAPLPSGLEFCDGRRQAPCQCEVRSSHGVRAVPALRRALNMAGDEATVLGSAGMATLMFRSLSTGRSRAAALGLMTNQMGMRCRHPSRRNWTHRERLERTLRICLPTTGSTCCLERG